MNLDRTAIDQASGTQPLAASPSPMKYDSGKRFPADDRLLGGIFSYMSSSINKGGVRDTSLLNETPHSHGFTSVSRPGRIKTDLQMTVGEAASASELIGLEDVERRELESIRDHYFMTFVHDFSHEYHCHHSDKRSQYPETVVWQIYAMFFRKMRAFTSQQFLTLFGQGIRRSALTMSDVATLVASLVTIDTLVGDDDVHSLAYPAMPGRRISVLNAPVDRRPSWYAFMAAKHSFLNANIDIEDFREVLVRWIYEKDASTVPMHMRIPKQMLDNAMVFLHIHPAFQELSKGFYQYCVELEEKYLGECPENTIPFEYQRGEIVGSGSFGQVYRCVNAKNGSNVALKEVPLPRIPEKERAILVEITTLKMLNHENIVKLQGYNIDREVSVIHILMEFCQHSLRYVIDQHGGLTASLIQHYSRQLLQGLAYLHSENVIHRDIKAANVLVDGSVAKLSDFGTAYRAEVDEGFVGESNPGSGMFSPENTESTTSVASSVARPLSAKRGRRETRVALAGTPLFMAPELLKGVLPSEASDIWAFGCVVFEMITADYPWRELTNGNAVPIEMFAFRLGQVEAPPQLPPDAAVPESLRSMLYACLNLDAAARPSAAELLTHEFFSHEIRTGGVAGEVHSMVNVSPIGSAAVGGEVSQTGATLSSMGSTLATLYHTTDTVV